MITETRPAPAPPAPPMVLPDDPTEWSEYSEEVARECVRLGSLWLDRIAPGWESKINKDTLMMHSLIDCIWGQVFGDQVKEDYGTGWGVGCSLLYRYKPSAKAIRYGSEVPFIAPSVDEYAILEQAWLDELARRG